MLFSSGDDSEEEPPVPIPNTEVKLLSAEDTWRETARENRALPVLRKSCNLFIKLQHIWPHGQAVKTSPFHGGNPGSIPGGVTRLTSELQ